MQAAETILNEVREKKLSVEDRCEKAVALAHLMIEEAHRQRSASEQYRRDQLAGMMADPKGKSFTTAMTDQCFRSTNNLRVADQLIYLLKRYGTPRFLTFDKRSGLTIFKGIGKYIGSLLVPLIHKLVHKESTGVIVPGEEKELEAHMHKRFEEKVRVNLNHIGEAIHGEEEAAHRLSVYLEDLRKPEVEYISVKVSTIFSQLNLLAWEDTLEILCERLKQLYRVAKQHTFKRPDGTVVPKFVNLDMEEYRDLHLTVEMFKKVLDDPEFLDYSAGIVLQAYLPDSFNILQELTQWAIRRVERGGARIKVRIVKGANLAMERVDSAVHGWPQAPYNKKFESDANFKRMVHYACLPEHTHGVYIGIGSHNLFDIAYVMLLRIENNVEADISFEMLEGMAPAMSRVVHELSGDILLYCPAANYDNFESAVAYLMRRLDENTSTDNFLRHAFSMEPGSKEWEDQVSLFCKAAEECDTPRTKPNRTQDRSVEPSRPEPCCKFLNEPDTDWSLPQNRKWAEGILKNWSTKVFEPIPVVVGGKSYAPSKNCGIGKDPSRPEKVLYQYALATEEQLEQALVTAGKQKWGAVSPHERAELLEEAAHLMRQKRGDLIGVMIADGGKTIPQADAEISEAIDFVDYYRRMLIEWSTLEDIRWKPKGTALIAPPWNFPCSIPVGGIAAALAAGNTVLFKPAPETTLVGWLLANIFWEAGFSKEVLQFIPCDEKTVGTKMLQDPRINLVVLTGATETAKYFLKLRPGMDLIAETGGKNCIIVTALADRDLAIGNAVYSAFGHAGQKCSACSLLILEAEVYDCPKFRRQLLDAAASWKVGSAWDPASKVNPLIRDPDEKLYRALTQLEPGEEWLLQPKQYAPNVWSPGIKYGVQPDGFTHTTELFGPVLGVMRADNLDHAIDLANSTRYGLTSGIQTLDKREQEKWIYSIQAGNCYINRGITGAIVQRQPFGGCKESCFGPGAKAGGPNYLVHMMIPEQIKKTQDSYQFYWDNYFSKDHDPTLLLGQDNILRYVPRDSMVLRVQEGDSQEDIARVVKAAQICGTPLEVSTEDEESFIKKLQFFNNVRLLSEPSVVLQIALAEAACNVFKGPVLANGRLELLNYLREVSISIDYHRYGNLGDRENEKRSPLPSSNYCAEECHAWN